MNEETAAEIGHGVHVFLSLLRSDEIGSPVTADSDAVQMWDKIYGTFRLPPDPREVEMRYTGAAVVAGALAKWLADEKDCSISELLDEVERLIAAAAYPEDGTE